MTIVLPISSIDLIPPSCEILLCERVSTDHYPKFVSGSASESISWFNESYPINDMCRSAERNHRRKVSVGRSYKITYQDISTVKTERIIDVRER